MKRMLSMARLAWPRFEQAVAASRLFRSLLASGRRRAAAVKLAELDERTLQDIGLEPWRSALGAEVALRRHASRRRLRAAYLGLW